MAHHRESLQLVFDRDEVVVHNLLILPSTILHTLRLSGIDFHLDLAEPPRSTGSASLAVHVHCTFFTHRTSSFVQCFCLRITLGGPATYYVQEVEI
jgi:hypothetical protein